MGALLPSPAGREDDFGSRRVTLEKTCLSCAPPWTWPHETLLVNSKTLSKSALKMTVKALKSPAYALNKIRSQSMDFRTRHINQQSLLCLYFMGLNLSNEQIAHELSINESDAYLMTTALRGGIVKKSHQ